MDELPSNYRVQDRVARCNEFVRETVLPQTNKGQPEGAAGGRFDRAGLAVALREWLEKLYAMDSGSSVLVQYDYSTDYNLLTRALDNELPGWLEGCNVSSYLGWVGSGLDIELIEENPHHALVDAKYLRRDWMAVRAAEVARFGK